MSHHLTVVVLAAGEGTRMKSKTMKVLHQVGGRSMIGHVLTAVRAVEPQRVVAVIGNQRDQVGPHVREYIPDCVLAVQEHARRHRRCRPGRDGGPGPGHRDRRGRLR